MLKSIRFLCIFLLPLIATAQTVDFNFQSADGLFCNPSTIQFTQNISGGATGYIWNLGNGLKTTRVNPVTTYTNPGSYTVSLTAFFPSGPVEIIKNIVIAPAATPNIIVDRDYICQPGPINFTVATGGNIINYDWDFGDTTGVIPSTTNTITHSFANYGSFTAIVKATSAEGCFGQDTIQIAVRKVPIAAKADPVSGCIPATVNFTSSDTIPFGDAVANYTWDFGDGTAPVVNNNNSTSYQYNKTGFYAASLIIATTQGCTNTFKFPTLAYGTPPFNTTASAKEPSICGSDSAVLMAKATNANRYVWSFGDGSTKIVIDTIVKHKYTTLGIKTITVTPLFNGCPGPSTTFTITIKGVIASYTFANTCTEKNTFTFRVNGAGNRDNASWTYGDSSPLDTGRISSHTFPPTGQFITILKVIDPPTGCIDTISKIIYTATPGLINADSSLCKNMMTTFAIANNYYNPATNYTWTAVGNKINSRLDSLTIKANILGNFRDTVFIKNGLLYCIDTLTLDHIISVHGPKIDYTIPASVCFGDNVTITNNSVPFVAADSVISWLWSFGNGIPDTTIYQPDPIQYTGPGTFRIQLIATDINGCRDSLRKVVRVNPLPFLSVSPATDTLCAGQRDSLFAFHTGTLLWSPGSGLSCITCDTVLANPAVTTQYIITATGAGNCSIQDSILVKVVQPFTALSPGDQFVCLKSQVTLDMNPKNKVIVWSPATGLNNANIYTPTVSPTQTTTYTATLTDSLGCFPNTADITVFINTTPTVNAGPDKVVPYNSAFNITPAYSNNVASYLWSPSATLSCSSCANPNGTAVTTETYTITATSDSGCVASDQVAIIIECKQSNIFVPTAFTPNGDNLNDYFYPITRGIKTIVKFIIYNREGLKVYEGHNLPPNSKTLGWDGSFRGKSQSATGYVYILEAVCDLGETFTKSGSVMLLR